jgi:hypothetical protein
MCKTVVITDTSVLINFLVLDRACLLKCVPTHRFVVTDHVRSEVTAHGSSGTFVANFQPLHQNLWATSGVGSFPSVCRSATSATLYDLNP